MVVVPPLTPVTRPEEELTVARDVEADVHVPPPRLQLNDLVDPAHTEDVPVITEEKGVTEKVLDA